MSSIWMDAYRAGRDYSWWREFGDRSDCIVTGFTYRHSACLMFESGDDTGNAETHFVSGRLVALLASQVGLGMEDIIPRTEDN